MSPSSPRPILVVGAGISGVTCALEAAEAGTHVLLAETEPFVGGRALRMHHYFPKLCPPSCGMEINVRRLERNPRIQVLTSTNVIKTERTDKGWSVKVKRAPEHVNNRCTLCGECSKVCPVKVPDTFNLGLCQAPAIRLAHAEAWPRRYVLDRKACPPGCKKCVEACKYAAINLDAAEREESLDVSAIVMATGWKPYPLEKLPELGGGVLADVIANVHLERLAAPAGPTSGKILRPSDGKPPKRVAFVQCAGSRDINHLPYCSSVCCMASLKQAIYVREQIPESEVTIYYIDRRTPGRNEDFLTKVAGTAGVKLVKGKVGKVEKSADGSLTLRVENQEAQQLLHVTVDLVVLATGMVSNLRDGTLPTGLHTDADGFGLDDPGARLLVAGVTRRPEDVAASVRDATGAAAKAMAAAERSA
jgi:quinone-modifying oxidoreductase, subunit QmoA